MRVFKLAALVMAVLCVVWSAIAGADGQVPRWERVHCGENHGCIEYVAANLCFHRHDAFHCRIYARDVTHTLRGSYVLSVSGRVFRHTLGVTPCITVACLQRTAQELGNARYGQGQGACVVGIVDIEDPGWIPTQLNTGGSTAYGLPQALGTDSSGLPGSKMSVAGSDWATNGVTQLHWLVDSYIPTVYGTPCNALAHDRSWGWY